MITDLLNTIDISELQNSLIDLLEYEIKINNKKINKEKLTKDEQFFDLYFFKPSTILKLVNYRERSKNENI